MSAAAPDYAAPVIGWRTWLVDDSGPEARLSSVVRDSAWPVGEPILAACTWGSISHPPPGRGCRCGIHAARDVAEAAFHAELPSVAGMPLGIGLVALWGRVVEGGAGWRASAAYPESLYLPVRRPEEGEIYDRIAWDLSAYGVPIAIVDCAGRGLVEALRDLTPLAERPLPVPIAA